VCSRAARGSGRDFLGRHYAFKGNDDVGLPGADGTGTGVTGQQVAQRVGVASLDAVAHHNPGAGLGSSKEADRVGYWLTHQFILGVPARFAGTAWGIISSDVRLRPCCRTQEPAGCRNPNVERPGT